MNQISISIHNFNNKIKQMNQTASKQLIMTSDEARNLHNDIFNLLANLAELQSKPSDRVQKSDQVSLDGGSF